MVPTRKNLIVGFLNLISIIIGGIILIGAGIYNEFPLVYSDTGTYIHTAFKHIVPNDRPLSYGLFIKHVLFNNSLWSVIVCQGLILSTVLYGGFRFVLSKNPLLRNITFISTVLVLSITTGVSWYTSQIMPDIFAPISILALVVILSGFNRVTWPLKIFLPCFLLISNAMHVSHFLISTGILAIALIAGMIFKKRTQKNLIPKTNLTLATVLVGISMISIPSIHYYYSGNFVITKASHVQLTARMIDNGLLKKYLNEHCQEPNEPYKLCKYKDSLASNISPFLWDKNSVLHQVGGWEASKKVFQPILNDMLSTPKYIALNVYTSLKSTLNQLGQNTMGSGLSPYREESPPYGQVHWRFKEDLDQYMSSKQNQKKLDFSFLNQVQNILLWLSLVFTLITLFYKPLRAKLFTSEWIFILLILLAIVLNSLATAGIHMAYDRFQARVVWLLPLCAIIILILQLKRNYLKPT